MFYPTNPRISCALNRVEAMMKMRIGPAILVVAIMLAGCGGGGGNSRSGEAVVTPDYKMTEVLAPANAGVKGGFNYASMQPISVDIALPYPGGMVSVYEKRPVHTLYDAANNAALKGNSSAELLARGFSSAVADSSGLYHYSETITVPAATASVYVEPMMGVYPGSFSVPIIFDAATYTFTAGGTR